MKIWVALFILCLILVGCGQNDAFQSQRLEFQAAIEKVDNLVNVTGTTNLPDGFKLFIRVDAAPDLGAEANWAGAAVVSQGKFVFETIFSDPLPYVATIHISPAINPKWAEFFTGDRMPFAFDKTWEVNKLADGRFELQRQIKGVFGKGADHARTLSPALTELEKALSVMERDGAELTKHEADGNFSLARFGRLHANHRRELYLEAPVTNQYFPKAFDSVRLLERGVEEYYLYVLAIRENNTAEMEKLKSGENRINKRAAQVRRKIEEIRENLKKVNLEPGGPSN